MTVEEGERERDKQMLFTLHKKRPLCCLSRLHAPRAASRMKRGERERESEKGETAKRIPIVKLNACTDNDQSN